MFGKPVFDYQLTRMKLARMAALIQAGRQFSYDVARRMGRGEGTLAASMVKAYVCRTAEWVTREAMQIHGGMGYAEEFAVSRYFVDARVLSIFEGADETLCLRVIARKLAEDARLRRGVLSSPRRRLGLGVARSTRSGRRGEVSWERAWRPSVRASARVLAREPRSKLGTGPRQDSWVVTMVVPSSDAASCQA